MVKSKIMIILGIILLLIFNISTAYVFADEIDKIEKINNVIDFTNIMLNIDNNEATIIGEKKIIYDEKKDELKEVSIKEEKKEETAKGKKREISKEDYECLLRIVEAEAEGEGVKGKILVANVIFNRYDTGKYKSLKDVIFEENQFSPIKDGRYNKVEISEETKEAIKKVLDGTDYSDGALYFMNPKTASKENKKWFEKNLKYLFTYKSHAFYKDK